MNKKQSETTQAKQWKQEQRINKRKIQSNHKEIPKLFSFSSTIHPWNEKVSKLLQQTDQSDLKINKQEKQIFSKLKKIDDSVNEFKQILKYYDHTHDYLHKVEVTSESIVSRLENYKTEMATIYDELAEVDERLTEELQLCDRKIEFIQGGNYDEEVQQKGPKNKENRENNFMKKEIPKEKKEVIQPLTPIERIQIKMKEKEGDVEKVQVSIRELGKNLGWVEEDHSDFVSIWNRCHGTKNYFEIEEELGNYFNFYTGEQIQQHMNKYMHFKKLVDRKKQLITEYKHLKEEKKQEELKIFENDEHEKRKRIKKEEERKKMEEEQKLMKQKVDEWKKQKQQKKVNEKQKLIEMEHNKRKDEQQRRKEEQIRAKQALEKWKEQQSQKRQKQTIRGSVKRPSSAVNREAMERIREREDRLIKEKTQIVAKKKKQQEDLEKKAQKIKEQKMLKYAYVNSKVEEKTTAMKEKEREKFDGKEKKQANTFGGQLLMTGVRAIPTWRQGL